MPFFIFDSLLITEGDIWLFSVSVQADLGFNMNILDIGGGFTGSEFQLKQVGHKPLKLVQIFAFIWKTPSEYMFVCNRVCAGWVCSQATVGCLLQPAVRCASVGPARLLLCGLSFQPGC